MCQVMPQSGSRRETGWMFRSLNRRAGVYKTCGGSREAKVDRVLAQRAL